MEHDERWISRFKWLGAGVFVFFTLWNHGAFSHDFWKTGQPVDPVTKGACCGSNDTVEIDPSKVEELKGVGFLLKDTNEVIVYARVLPSPDNAMWVSRMLMDPKHTRCFFYPSGY